MRVGSKANDKLAFIDINIKTKKFALVANYLDVLVFRTSKLKVVHDAAYNEEYSDDRRRWIVGHKINGPLVEKGMIPKHKIIT